MRVPIAVAEFLEGVGGRGLLVFALCPYLAMQKAPNNGCMTREDGDARRDLKRWGRQLPLHSKPWEECREGGSREKRQKVELSQDPKGRTSWGTKAI